jgi:predicted TIM-barrel fold metal-dependent hydrolase
MTQKPARVLVSADSHVSDFPSFWNAELLATYGSRTMHVSKDGGTSAHGISQGGLFGDWIVGEGIVPFPAGGGNVGGYPRDERPKRLANFDLTRDAPPGAVDPHARLKEMDADGLRAEVIIPTYALRVNMMRDAELQRACLRAANVWTAEYCRAVPDRLIGAAVLSIHDPAAAVEDLHRCLELGLKSAVIPAIPPPELTYASMHYERFWAAAAEAGTPVILHALPAPETAAVSQRRKATVVESRVVNLIEEYHLANILYDHPIQISLSQLILSGVLERHPKLRVVISEWGSGWMANFLGNIDFSFASRPEGLSLKMPPSDYFARQIWCSFDRELSLPRPLLERLQDRLMFSSDYPHIESSWPTSHAAFERAVEGAPEAIQTKLAWKNVATLYGLPEANFQPKHA